MKDTTKVDKNDFLHKKNNVFQTIMPNHSVARIKPFQTVCPSLAMGRWHLSARVILCKQSEQCMQRALNEQAMRVMGK